jgi:hypothetical protein
MNASNLRSTLAAAAVGLSLLAPAAQAEGPGGSAELGAVIAAQGNAALQQIRDELALELLLKFALPLTATPSLPAPPRAGAQAASAEAYPNNHPEHT